MLFKKIFSSSQEDDKYSKLEQKLQALELELQKLQLLEEKWETKEEKTVQPPVVIERVHIDKVVFDKFELNNNFGQLGIKELKGKLNIGATYGSDMFQPEEEAKPQQEKSKEKAEKPAKDGPAVNIRSRGTSFT
ncbi:hypothetical protein [Ectobacillus ponti]|uniref:Uncharacterized protein n=1 Tax=Ectobacillus ponti TaxID=2961894 RepID=A0AA42BRA8_9BACI|nr:hypothetical protein [Ectobacillus ponti]MCP8969294.1 hypothetical protein [Ectobacillus ponti]